MAMLNSKGDKPDHSNPYIVKGCETDGYFRHIGCKGCYDDKKEIGSDKYFVCSYCCTGDRCNGVMPGFDAGLQLKGGILASLLSAVFALTLSYY